MESSEMTWNDLVRKYIPKATDKECHEILWEFTAFPLASVPTVEMQIQAYKASKGL